MAFAEILEDSSGKSKVSWPWSIIVEVTRAMWGHCGLVDVSSRRWHYRICRATYECLMKDLPRNLGLFS